eukprot:GHVP01014765.1.p1 GENE.GHVP01014765.1~~GHVP01014765.1.p1  ORF type:complete len:1352 (+),score=253.61 GHVP01014765.1:68-4057(+)
MKDLAVIEISKISSARGNTHISYLLERTCPCLLSENESTRETTGRLLKLLLEMVSPKYKSTEYKINSIDFNLNETFNKSNIFVEDVCFVYEQSNLSIREKLALKRRRKETVDNTQENGNKLQKDLNEEIKNSTDIIQALIMFLLKKLHSTKWIIRHGASLGLSYIFQTIDISGLSHFLHNNDMNIFIQDICKKLFELLVHERFSDFVGCHVETPVKDACVSATYFLIISPVFSETIDKILEIFLQMGCSQDWHIRHSSITMLSHVIKAKNLFGVQILDFCIVSLIDNDGDIRECSANILSDVYETTFKGLVLKESEKIIKLASKSLSEALETENVSFTILLITKLILESTSSMENALEMILKYTRHHQHDIRKEVLLCIQKTMDLTDLELKNRLFLNLFASLSLETDFELLKLCFTIISELVLKKENLLLQNLEKYISVLKTPLKKPYKTNQFQSVTIVPSQESFFSQNDLNELSIEEIVQNKIYLARLLNGLQNHAAEIEPLLTVHTHMDLIIALESKILQKDSLYSLLESSSDDMKGGLKELSHLFRTKHKSENGYEILLDETNLSLEKLNISIWWARECSALNLKHWISNPSNEIDTVSTRLLYVYKNLSKNIISYLVHLGVHESIVLSTQEARIPFEENKNLEIKGITLLSNYLGRIEELGFTPTLEKEVYILLLYFLNVKDSLNNIVLKESLLSNDPLLRYLAVLTLSKLSIRSDSLLISLVKSISRNLNLEGKDNYYIIGNMETALLLLITKPQALIAYSTILLMPVLSHLTNEDTTIRGLASLCFAELVSLVPLNKTEPFADDFEMQKMQEKAIDFMSQLGSGPKELEDYKVLAVLRSYQEKGISWLCFLQKFNLNGALCDDMGLGKTIQTLCAIYLSLSKIEKKMPSIIICPSILICHWIAEANKFFPYMSTLIIPHFSFSYKRALPNLCVCTYETAIKSSLVQKTSWHYCVLDEAHFIKNHLAKKTIGVKKISSNHRVVLTGTPIQNDVVELWSLFDFLMPGFLGSYAEFMERYSKPIKKHRHGKYLRSEERKSIQAMVSLKKKVSPFLLRRMKENVLDDLPEKTIQDYYCEMTNIQKTIYDDLEYGSEGREGFNTSAILQKVCIHPVASKERSHIKLLDEISTKEGKEKTDFSFSGKLTGLFDLLKMCGLEESSVSRNRFLIFSQTKEALDIVENSVITTQFPNTCYIKLDSIPVGNKRFEAVERFNQDPSVDILLTTTQAGGHGLNLTGANTVIFVEHNWNPQIDLQAMDRAHRLGQTRGVNVYRLIVRDTIEERKMNIQSFKIRVASTVVEQQVVQSTEQEDLSENTTFDLLDLLKK